RAALRLVLPTEAIRTVRVTPEVLFFVVSAAVRVCAGVARASFGRIRSGSVVAARQIPLAVAAARAIRAAGYHARRGVRGRPAAIAALTFAFAGEPPGVLAGAVGAALRAWLIPVVAAAAIRHCCLLVW